jgi:hypothetical protein
MFSRFVTWQEPTVAAKTEVEEQNMFQVGGECLDIRFGLKGYGFKKVGEENRAIYHFGNYKCYLRKVGDTDFKLFANAVCERAATESENVYKDIFVSTGVLEMGEYEVKVEAARLVELKAWSGGVVEGIDDGDQFWHTLQARQALPNHIRVHERIRAIDFANQGVDPLPIEVLDPNPIFSDALQVLDWLQGIALEHNIYGIYDEVTVEDVLTIQYDYDLFFFDDVVVAEFAEAFLPLLFLIPSNFGDSITVTENLFAAIPGYNFGVDKIKVTEFVSLNVIRTAHISDSINVTESVSLNKPGFREVNDAIAVSEFSFLDIVGVINDAIELIYIDELFIINIEGDMFPMPYDLIFTYDYAVVVFAYGTGALSDSILVFDIASVNIFGSATTNDEIHAFDMAMVEIEFTIFATESLHIVENVSVKLPNITVADFVFVSEFVGMALLSPSLSEYITVNENVSVKIAHTIEVFDGIIVSEKVFANGGAISINVIDTITVADVFMGTSLDVAGGDDASVNGALFDIILVGEFISLLAVTQSVSNSFDFIAVTENVSVFIGTGVVVADNAGVNGALFDSIGVSEFVALFGLAPLVISRSDSVAVTESRTIEVGVGRIDSFDQANVSGALFESINVQEFVIMGII